MIKSSEIKKIVNEYTGLKIGVLGSHSALEVMDGAKDEDIKTIVICQKGRDTPYRRFSRIADEIVVLNKFKEMASSKFQKKLREEDAIIVPHRALTAYLGYKTIENDFKVPIFGDRALFTVTSYLDYKKKSDEKIKQGIISKKDLQNSSIEELVIGTYLNFNYFHTPISENVDFIGIERRLQTNLHDFNALPAKQQLEMDVDLQNIEVGHTPASIRESLLEKVIIMGDKFVKAVKKEYSPGIIGPFSLQSVVTKDLELIVYDVSLRVPGNPIVATTSPYTKYQYGKTFGVGRRIAMEIRRAQEQGRLEEIVT